MFLLIFHLFVLRVATAMNSLQTQSNTYNIIFMPTDYQTTLFVGPEIDILPHDVVPVADSYGYKWSVEFRCSDSEITMFIPNQLIFSGETSGFGLAQV